jgi:hypothetical protein
MRRNQAGILLIARHLRGRNAANPDLMTTQSPGRRLKTIAATLLGIAFLVLASSLPSRAQQIPFRMELFGGYSYMHFDSHTFGFADSSDLNGGNLSVSVPHIFRSKQYRPLGVVLDASANYGSHLTVYNFMVGPQVTVDKKGYTFFAHGLFGKSRERFGVEPASVVGFSSLGRAIAFGGGVQKNWRPQFAVRLVQVDYLNNNNFGLSQNNLRISTGLVFQFGGK